MLSKDGLKDYSIEFSNSLNEAHVRSMWKTCFGDSDEFIELFFSSKYKHENTLIYLKKGIPVASLQMIPYKIRFYGEIIPFYYLAGLCTLPEFRNKGLMSGLIHKAYQVMQERMIALAILVPAEEWLFDYYSKFGFEKTFERGDKPINLKEILDRNNANLELAFLDFDQQYQQKDFCVLKNLEDFKAIIKENTEDNFALKYNIAGMSSILDIEKLLQIYSQKNEQVAFKLKVNDQLRGLATIYSIGDGKVTKGDFNIDFEVTSKMLTRLLFGFKTNLVSPQYTYCFKQHEPIMNLMLE